MFLLFLPTTSLVHISEKTLSFLNGEFEVEPGFGEKREEALRMEGLKTYFITKVLKPVRSCFLCFLRSSNAHAGQARSIHVYIKKTRPFPFFSSSESFFIIPIFFIHSHHSKAEGKENCLFTDVCLFSTLQSFPFLLKLLPPEFFKWLRKILNVVVRSAAV